MMLLNSHWKSQLENAFEVLLASKIDYSPITCCFTPALPYPRSITPLTHSKLNGCDLSKYQMIFYIHVPFCSRRCTFCPFFVNTSTEIPDEYTDVLIKHIKQIIKSNVLPPVFSLTFGGGSPNLLSISRLKEILDIFGHYTIQANIEVHPECGGKTDYFKELAQIGINSVSVGMQSSDNFLLKSSNRGHNSKMVHQIVSDIKETRLLLNIDIMYGGLYGETIENAYSTFIDVFETLRPDIINAYKACFHEGLPENTKYKRQPDKYPDVRTILEITALMHQLALKNDYWYTGQAYFVRAPLQNLAQRKKRFAILAVGPGTYSYVFDENRSEGFIFFAPYHMQRYYELVYSAQQPVERMLVLDEEYLMRWGVIHDLKYGNVKPESISKNIFNFLNKLCHLMLMRRTQAGFSVSDSGRCIEDLIYAALMPRSMWIDFSERKKKDDYTVSDAKYDWFFDPDVVLGFQDFVQKIK